MVVNLQKFWICGEALMDSPYVVLSNEFETLSIAKKFFPMWSEWGVDDESVAIHSLGWTYLTTIGQQNGYVCCSEFPVMSHTIRADSVWWNPDSKQISAVFEFERHKEGPELKEKVKNLLKAYHSLQRKPELLCLVFWTKSEHNLLVNQNVLNGLWDIFQRGFRDNNLQQVPPASVRKLRIFECVHISNSKGQEVLSKIKERKRYG